MKRKHVKPKLLVFEVEVPNGGPGGLERPEARLVWGVSREDALRRARLRKPGVYHARNKHLPAT